MQNLALLLDCSSTDGTRSYLTLSAGFKAPPASFEAFQANSETLPANSETIPAGSKPLLIGSKPLLPGYEPLPAFSGGLPLSFITLIIPYRENSHKSITWSVVPYAPLLVS